MAKYFLIGLTQTGSLELEPGFNTVGRNPTNDLRIRDATVSSFHCEIIRKDDSIMVRDLGSTNGTFVDGQRIEESPLETDSILRVGSVEFTVQRQEEEALKVQLQEEEALPPIVVPKLSSTQPDQAQQLLPDGFPACLNHNDAHATFECRRCQKKFCPSCVNLLRLSGGNARVFCPSCSGLCEELPVPKGVSTTPTPKPDSVLGRLSQTIRIRFK
jgi:hypothetical protein